jgi:HAD superfamily phosphoserine phosphatase-like hydrolase
MVNEHDSGSHPRALVVFDLDGTLLRGPTVCEVLAQSLDRLPRMQEIERLTDREAISAAREEMALWYRDVPPDGLLLTLREAQLAPGLAAGIALLQDHGVAIAIASITWQFAVEHFARTMGIDHCFGTALEDSGTIRHAWPQHKADWVRELARSLGVPLERTAAVGDSAGDYAMLDIVGMPIFVGAELPPSRSGWRHYPAANIEHVARYLVDSWKAP